MTHYNMEQKNPSDHDAHLGCLSQLQFIALLSPITLLACLAVRQAYVRRFRENGLPAESTLLSGTEGYINLKEEISWKQDQYIDHETSPIDDSSQNKDSSRYITSMALSLILCAALIWFGYIPFSQSFSTARHIAGSALETTQVLDVFQVYQPVSTYGSRASACEHEILLMDHVFAFSYGKPFVGYYQPPQCDFDTVRINLTVSSRGRQFDRLAIMYLGDIEVFRTSTAEPTNNGIQWTYIKEMSQYNTLWKEKQKLIFDLGNLISDVYTGSFNVTLTAFFSQQGDVHTADVILPISAGRSASNGSSAFTVPSDNTTTAHRFPDSAARAVVSISACGQSTEEFWWSNVFSGDTESFESTVGELYGYSPFREIQLYIDGLLAGVVWPFPIIFTGGVAPGFWRPIVGIDAFDLRQPEIDISPFLPFLKDGREHSFEIKVAGLHIQDDGNAILSDHVGSYWVITGNIFVYLDEDAESISNDAPQIYAPAPSLMTSRNSVQNETGGNDTLVYSVIAKRTITITSPQFSWQQSLEYSNFGLLSQQGLSQKNNQITHGRASIINIGGKSSIEEVTFTYPLSVHTTYNITDTGLAIDAELSRGLDIEATALLGISTYTLTSEPLRLHTRQKGSASYRSVTGGASTSSGDTSDTFQSDHGQLYQRTVRAVNGSVVSDTDAPSKSSPSHVIQDTIVLSSGRDNIRSIIGRGPGNK